MESFVALISNVGFPIAAVIALGWFIFQIYTQSVKREEELRQEIKDNQAVNAEAIKTLGLYAERLDTIQTDISEIKQDIIILANQ